MLNAGRPLPASARKYPADTHRSYLGCSTSRGTYWADSSGVVGASGVVVTVRVYGGGRGMKQPPEWPLMADGLSPAPSPYRSVVSSADPNLDPPPAYPTEPRDAADEQPAPEDLEETDGAPAFVGTASVPAPARTRGVPAPPAGPPIVAAAAPAPPPARSPWPPDGIPTSPPVQVAPRPRMIPPLAPAVPWSASGPPARAVSG